MDGGVGPGLGEIQLAVAVTAREGGRGVGVVIAQGDVGEGDVAGVGDGVGIGDHLTGAADAGLVGELDDGDARGLGQRFGVVIVIGDVTSYWGRAGDGGGVVLQAGVDIGLG